MLWAVTLAFVVNGVAALGVAVALRSRKGELPFGPSLALGALLVIALVS